MQNSAINILHSSGCIINSNFSNEQQPMIFIDFVNQIVRDFLNLYL